MSLLENSIPSTITTDSPLDVLISRILNMINDLWNTSPDIEIFLDRLSDSREMLATIIAGTSYDPNPSPSLSMSLEEFQGNMVNIARNYGTTYRDNRYRAVISYSEDFNSQLDTNLARDVAVLVERLTRGMIPRPQEEPPLFIFETSEGLTREEFCYLKEHLGEMIPNGKFAILPPGVSVKYAPLGVKTISQPLPANLQHRHLLVTRE